MKSILLFGALALATSQINAQSTIFEETFVYTSSAIPPNWATLNNDNDVSSWYRTTNPISMYGFLGGVMMSFGEKPDNVLITPAINLPTGSSYKLSFQIGSFIYAYPENYYMVYVLPATSTYTGTETPVLAEAITVGDLAFNKTVDLTSFAGQSVKIYFRHYYPNSVDNRVLVLDNVKVTQQVLGTSEVAADNTKIGLYPNPATDYINIDSKTAVLKAEVYDMTGRKINADLEGNKLNITELQSGNYLLKIETKEGVTSEKFIKK
ncbi:T9SS-dependent choice-of-anchor J family protein [Chryseobacterium sp. JUb7]|uniref:T9SS-dependent choice-of-anchor J family protein n=1 Tax=Chryseobacterium sp. JUb7 TaxID=2940599 RepID=UPI0021682DA3|nr:T9SS type A sorting domain-containing protein [Chryseobacterium sp. JUb7]MCS3528807.1 hypothetical protein [Chryseobacterium sp. JUb7]